MKEEMTYEEFKKIKEKVAEEIRNGITKEQYEEVLKIAEINEEFEKKIEELASSYKIGSPNDKIFGYYTILEYCLKQIKMNDKNIMIGFGSSK